MRRTCCAVCGGEITDFLDLGSSPLADEFPDSVVKHEVWYPLQVAVCPACWLVQLREVVPDEELFGAGYGFRTGSSPSQIRYFAELARSLTERFRKQARRLVVEIACNDGTLLQNFVTAGYPVMGFEPVKPAAAEAAARGAEVISELFRADLVRESRVRHQAGLVIACNVAAHVSDPLDFMAGVRELLAPNGVAVLEFQDLAALIAGCQFDHVYHEHRFFYSLTAFSRLAARVGLEVVDWQRTPAQGGSLRVFLQIGDNTLHAHPWLESIDVYRSMQGRAEAAKRMLLDLLDAEVSQASVVAGYGASAKSATLFNFCGIGPHEVSWVEDLTPGKIGRYTPGSHIPILAPGFKPDTYLLTSWNYAGAVIRKEAEFLATGGRIIIPGAVPVML